MFRVKQKRFLVYSCIYVCLIEGWCLGLNVSRETKYNGEFEIVSRETKFDRKRQNVSRETKFDQKCQNVSRETKNINKKLEK